MRITYILPAIVFALSGTAYAGGPMGPVETPMVQMPAAVPSIMSTDWSGGYVGASIGYGDATLEVDELDPLQVGLDGVLGGLFAGYQYDFGRFVLGAELDLNAANIDADFGELVDLIDDGLFGGDLNPDVSIDQIHRLKMRAGYDAGDALIYGVAGLAYAELDVSALDFDENYSDTGYILGMGVDVRLSQNIVAGAEVLYHQFDDFDLDDDLGDIEVDASVTTIAARVAYQF